MNIDWSVFERRSSDNSVVAAHWVQRTLARDPATDGESIPALQAELADMSDNLLWHVAACAKVDMLELPVDAGRRRHLALVEMLESALRERRLAVPGENVDAAKLAVENALRDEQAALTHNRDGLEPEPRLARFTQLVARIDEASGRGCTAKERRDLQQMRAMVCDSMAALTLVLDRLDDSVALYEEAAAGVQAVGLMREASAYRLKIVELYYGRATDFRQALTTLLKLKQDAKFVVGPLTEVIVDRMLAESYLRVGDAFEALSQVERVRSGLTQLGYRAPSGEIDGALVESWIRAADQSTDDPTDFYRRLTQVIRSFMSCANIVGQTDTDDARRARATNEVYAIRELSDLLEERRQAVARRNHSFMLSRQNLPGDDEGAPPTDEAVPVFDSAVLDEMRRREQNGDCSDDFQQDLEAAIAEAAANGDEQLRDALRDLLATVLIELDRFADAAVLWRDAARAALRRGDLGTYHRYSDQWLGALAGVGDNGALSTACGECIAANEVYRDALAAPNQQSAFIEQGMLCYQLGVFAALKLDDHNLMLQRIELAKAAASVRDMARRAATPFAGEADELQQRIRTLEAGMGSTPAAADMDQRRRLYDLVALRRADDASPPEPFSLAAVQAALSAEEAVLNYFWLPGNVLLIVGIDRHRVCVTRQLFGDEVMRRLRDLVAALDDMRRLELDQDALQFFLPLLLPEEVRPVLAGKRRLRISPNGLLHVFPFHVLQLDDDYLFQHYAISYLPNLSGLLLRFEEGHGHGTLAIGVSRFSTAGMRLPDLPAVATELDALQVQYARDDMPIEIWRDKTASLQRLREEVASGRAANYRVWHVATHGEDVLDNAAHPMETRLFLADGGVDGLEIGSWRIRADLVVLSVCHSGRRAYRNRLGQDTLNGDEMFGVPAAFLKAGARSVLGALWPAHDATTCELMTALHRHLRDTAPDYALQAAMRDCLRQRTTPEVATGSATESTGADDDAAHAAATRDVPLAAATRDVVPLEVEDGALNPAFWAPFFITQLGPLGD